MEFRVFSVSMRKRCMEDSVLRDLLIRYGEKIYRLLGEISDDSENI